MLNVKIKFSKNPLNNFRTNKHGSLQAVRKKHYGHVFKMHFISKAKQYGLKVSINIGRYTQFVKTLWSF